jgi:drug/metabolite transporter (DMT)-like permease
MKQISGQLGALEIILVRSLIACCALVPLVLGARGNEWRWGIGIGSVLFCAFYLQVAGLASTSSNRNAFVTGLNVVIVPLLALGLGQRLRWTLLAGALMGVLGLFGLFYEQAPWSVGDSLTLAGAFVYAIYVLMFEFSARSRPALRPARIALIQAATMAVLSLAFLQVGATPRSGC